ncbi:peptidase inhibitor family I36 protein [Actinomadura kijaniata]|uniref:peptidase inhibitor family I36 protein n=1 Tax=Actinomadura kijaniata TaxID=46161 RepID=UPI003F1D81B9
MNARQLPRAIALGGLALGTILTTFTGTADAAATPGPAVQDQVDAQLRAYPGGIQTGPREVSYRGGKVTLTFPDPARTAAADTCATGAYCFYEHKDFGGRKLTFRDCGGWQYLTDYGFGNKTSSWSNRSKNTVKVYDEGVSPRQELWLMEPDAASANIGLAVNDKADSFLTYCP